ncbi:hypothetical protein AKG11_31890 [Shinella sp. SUS2]|nr:hypothetical protein AKG11_31890 [Shinella sp. SUS2]
MEGVKAKVYAKTTKRVRVEMTRDLASARLPGAAHTFGALSGIISLIDDIALLEAGEVQMLLETIEQAVPADVRQMPPYELVRLILTTSPDPTVQAVLLSTIISERDEHPTFPFVIEAAR